MNEDNYVDGFKPFLMDVLYAWCKGATFLQLCKMTDIFEGTKLCLYVTLRLCETFNIIDNYIGTLPLFTNQHLLFK